MTAISQLSSAIPSGPYLRELNALQSEANSELLYEGLLNLGGRLARNNCPEAAVAIYRALNAQGQSLPESVRLRVEQRLGAMNGEGPAGARIEFLLDRFTREAIDPSMILGLGAAGAAFRMTRLATLSRLLANPSAGILTRGLGARAVAGVAGLAMEGLIFPAAVRAGNAALLRNMDWSLGQLQRELASSYLMLGAIRLSQGLTSRLLSQRLPPIRSLLSQTGILGGIFLGRRAEMALGLSPSNNPSTTLLDSAVMLLQFQVAGRIASQAFGASFRSWERGLDQQARTLSAEGSPAPRGWRVFGLNPLIPAAAGSPLEMTSAMMTSGGRGSGDGFGTSPSSGGFKLDSFNHVFRFVSEARFRNLIQQGHVIARIHEDFPDSLERRLEPLHSYLNILAKTSRGGISPGRRLILHSTTSNLRVSFVKTQEGFELELPVAFSAPARVLPIAAEALAQRPAAQSSRAPVKPGDPEVVTRGAVLKSIAIPILQKSTPDQLPSLLQRAYTDGGESDGPRTLIVEGGGVDWNPLQLNQWTQGLGSFPPKTIFQIFHADSRRTFIGQVAEGGNLEWALGNGNEWRIASLRAVRSQGIRLKNPVELYLYLQAIPNQSRGNYSAAELKDFQSREISILWEGPAPRTFQYDLKTFVLYSLFTHVPYGKSLVINFESGVDPIRMENYMGDLWMEENPENHP